MEEYSQQQEQQDGETKDTAPPSAVLQKAFPEDVLNAIYVEDDETFATLLSANPDLAFQEDGGYFLVHHLFTYYWPLGIQTYVDHGGRLDFKTVDRVYSGGCGLAINMFITGGQTILHLLAAKKSEEHFMTSMEKYPELNVKDLNGDLPVDIRGGTFQEKQQKRQGDYKKILVRCAIDISSCTPAEIVPQDIRTGGASNTSGTHNGIVHFEISKGCGLELANFVATLTTQIPNSMHRYGKVIPPECVLIQGLVKSLLDRKYHQGSIKNIHAFYIKYNTAGTGGNFQTKLDSHYDDSTFTINVCLNDSSTRGGDLIFDDLDSLVYSHQSRKGLMHSGSLKHHVNELMDGVRENIIIWVTTIWNIAQFLCLLYS